MTVLRESLHNARRIVIKVGTRVATEGDNAFSEGVIGSLVRQIASLKGPPAEGRSFIVVSSGAIALGLNRMGLADRPKEINLLQAAAAMGQSRLMHAYEREFEAVQTETAQILLTYEDIRSRARYLNIRNTIFTLWSFGVVPIVNENDTVSFAEIFRFADNDIISAHLAIMLDADLLVILTDTDGVYDRNPRVHGDARILRTVDRVTDSVLAAASGKGSAFSSGGMESKIRAADTATRSGIGVVIARGEGLDLASILAGREIGTWFVPAQRRMRGRKKWMASTPRTEGAIVVDRGAERAIVKQGRSLLPAGVKAITGSFTMGSVISILDEAGREVARGLSNFGSDDLEKIKGMNTKRIPEVLGVEEHFEEVVHRDNLVVVAPRE
ncbi:MAG: glutamate 5-kinase [Spirochaetia bacterium]|jgi:glutamate 5-kinase